MKQAINAISEVPRAQKTFANFAKRAWSAAKFPLMVAGLALTISAAAAFCNPAYSQKKDKAQVPTAQGDTLIANRAAGFAQTHASKSGETLTFIEAKIAKPSSAMEDTLLVRFDGKVALSKYDIMKLESISSLKRGNFRLYFDKKTSTIYLFQAPPAAPQTE